MIAIALIFFYVKEGILACVSLFKVYGHILWCHDSLMKVACDGYSSRP